MKPNRRLRRTVPRQPDPKVVSLPLQSVTPNLRKRVADFIPVGWAVRLVSVRALSRNFGLKTPDTLRFLALLRVPILRLGVDSDQWYINLPALEGALYVYLRPSHTGYRRRGKIGQPVLDQLLKLRLEGELEVISRLYADLSAKTLRRRLHRMGRIMAGVRKAYLKANHKNFPAYARSRTSSPKPKPLRRIRVPAPLDPLSQEKSK